MENRKLTYTRTEAAHELNVSLPMLDSWLKRADNPLPCIKTARRVIIPAEGLQRWIDEESKRSAGSAF